MSILLLAKRLRIDAIMRVQEHNQPSLLQRLPNRLQPLIVEPLPDSPRAEDDSAQVLERRDLLDGFKERADGDVWHEREEAKPVQPLECAEGGCRRAVRFKLLV